MVLEIWDFKYNDPLTRRAFRQVDELFTERYPEYVIEHRGFDDEDYLPTLKGALLAGTGPDLFMMHPGATYRDFSSYLAPLNSTIESSGLEFLAGVVESVTDEQGQILAMPITFQGIGWYYNKELFTAAGLDPERPPESFEEFYEVCRRLDEAGIIPIATGNNRPLTTDFIRRMLISGFFSGDQIENFYRQGRGFSSEDYRSIMEFIVTLRKEGWLDPAGIHRAYFNFAIDRFGSGEAAMIPGLLSDIANWKSFSDSLGKDTVGYFPNLKDPAMRYAGKQLVQTSGILFGLNRRIEGSETSLAAERYLNLFYSPEAQRILTGILGMLLPVTDQNLPVEEYPVLEQILMSLEDSGYDIEQYNPSSSITNQLYRYDKLLVNTLEIDLDEYLEKVKSVTSLY